MRKEWSIKLEEQYNITADKRTAGVYAIKDGDEIIYIGSSSHLYERLSRYHSKGNNQREVRKKTERGIQGWQIYQFCLDNPDFEFEILEIAEGLDRKELGQLEAEITKQYNPKFNFRAGNEKTERQKRQDKRFRSEMSRKNALKQDHTNYINACREKFGRRIVAIETGEEFECIKDAQRKYNDTKDVLTRVLTGKHETFNDWHWTYAHDPRTLEEIKSMYYPNRPKDYQKLIDDIRRAKINELKQQISVKKNSMKLPIKDKIKVDTSGFAITDEQKAWARNRAAEQVLNHLDMYRMLHQQNPDLDDEQIEELLLDKLYYDVLKEQTKVWRREYRVELIKLAKRAKKQQRNEGIKLEIQELLNQIQYIKDGLDDDEQYAPIREQIKAAQELQDKFINGHLEDGSGAISYGRTSEVKKREIEEVQNGNE